METGPKRSILKNWIAGAGLAMATVALVGYACWTYHFGRMSEMWPQTEGRVESVRVYRGKYGTDVHIKYRYSVQGREFSSSRLSFQFVHPPYVELKRKGDTVTVHYDPKNPASAVLYPGVSISEFAGALVLACFSLIASIVFLTIAINPESETDESRRISLYDQTGGTPLLGRISIGWELVRQSFRVLALDPELLVFPFLSGLCSLGVLASFFVPLKHTEFVKVVLHDNYVPHNPVMYLLLFAFYLASYFVITFFNTALVACAVVRFHGGNPTISIGLRFGIHRLPQILAWSLVCATVGVLLRSLEGGKSSWLRQFVVGLLGCLWSVGTFFVVPILVVEKLGPIEAFKRSARIIRENWGESVTATFSVGMIAFWAYLAACVPFSIGGAIGGNVAIAAGGAVSIALVMIIALASSALNAILLAALYLYVEQGKEVPFFNERLFDSAFEPQGE